MKFLKFIWALCVLALGLFVILLAALPILVGCVAGFICGYIRVGCELSDDLVDKLHNLMKSLE